MGCWQKLSGTHTKKGENSSVGAKSVLGFPTLEKGAEFFESQHRLHPCFTTYNDIYTTKAGHSRGDREQNAVIFHGDANQTSRNGNVTEGDTRTGRNSGSAKKAITLKDWLVKLFVTLYPQSALLLNGVKSMLRKVSYMYLLFQQPIPCCALVIMINFFGDTNGLFVLTAAFG